MKKNLTKNNISKEIIIFFVLLIISITPVFAQNLVPAQMTRLFDDLLKVFTGGIVKTILIMCLCGTAVAYAFNKDNEKMKRNIIAIFIGIAILCLASFIVGAVWDASGGGN